MVHQPSVDRAYFQDELVSDEIARIREVRDEGVIGVFQDRGQVDV
jgi:hypothetical protein